MFSNGGQGVLSESIQKHPNEFESVSKYDFLSTSRIRNVGTHSNSYLNKHAPEEPLLVTSDKSILPTPREHDAWLAPGNIVWVKDIRHGWWPAEVMDIRILEDNDYQHTARVLVQLFEVHERAWADASDLSQFPNYVEERSKNPSEPFQDALKQALCKYGKGSLRTSQDGCVGEMSPTQPDKSPAASDASNTSISGRAKNDHDEEGRGKRKRKTKIHFDEMAVADNPARKIRRLKIMRLLGLAAPVGSPFSPTHKSS